MRTLILALALGSVAPAVTRAGPVQDAPQTPAPNAAPVEEAPYAQVIASAGAAFRGGHNGFISGTGVMWGRGTFRGGIRYDVELFRERGTTIHVATGMVEAQLGLVSAERPDVPYVLVGVGYGTLFGGYDFILPVAAELGVGLRHTFPDGRHVFAEIARASTTDDSRLRLRVGVLLP
jgi:hypothetical protein